MKAQARKAKLWAPFCRSFPLLGVFAEEGELVQERAEMESLLLQEALLLQG